MKIREGRITECDRIAAIIAGAYRTVARRFDLTPQNCPKHPSNCTPQWVERDFSRGVRYYLAETGGEVIGCAALEMAKSDLCYLERLAVLPEKRTSGVGRKLVDHVFKEARESNRSRISIGIISKQKDLKEWYRKAGFLEGKTKTFDHLPFQVLFMEAML